MTNITLHELHSNDKASFLEAMRASTSLHAPWVKPPQTSEEFDEFLNRSMQFNMKTFIATNDMDDIIGVFNLSEIVRGAFQSSYLGYYAVANHAGKGLMSKGLKLLLKNAFNEMGLHRLEANIQPENISSIRLVAANGFRKEGYSPRYLNINGEWKDHERWAITLEDYQMGIVK